MRTWLSMLLGIVVVAAVVLLLLSITDRSAPPLTEPTGENGDPPLSALAVPQTPSVSLEQTVQLTTQFFSPSEITVNVGDTVTLIITSVDQDHGIFVSSTGEMVPAPRGNATSITLTPEAPGELAVLCNDRCEAGVAFTIRAQ